MQIILKQSVQNLGNIGSIASVKPGYARNFLIPKGIAESATPGNISRLEEELAELKKIEEEKIKSANKILTKIEKFSSDIVIEMNVTPEGGLYGSVGENDIFLLIKEQLGKFDSDDFNKKMVHLNQGPFKEPGEFSGQLILHPQVICLLNIKVVAVSGQ